MLSLTAVNDWFGTNYKRLQKEYFITGTDLMLSVDVMNKWFGTSYK